MPHCNCSVCRRPATSFSENPIGTLDALARMLQHSVEEVQTIARTAGMRYRPIRKLKAGGGVRTCYDALGDLKSIHARIRKMILEQVDYPPYLHGGIKDRKAPRGQKANAEQHINPGLLITVDIKQFFPSVGRQLIFEVWQRFFRFPPVVSDILTQLTTKDRCLPQGTKTSDLLANLVFWDVEADVVADFHARGITYTRLMDDISCSTKTSMTDEEKSYILCRLRAMVHQKGFQLNPKKQTIALGNQQQVTTKLVVNRKTSLTPKERSAIRSEVRALEKTPPAVRTTKAYEKKYARASGRVSYLKQHHRAQAQELRAILKSVVPPVRQ